MTHNVLLNMKAIMVSCVASTVNHSCFCTNIIAKAIPAHQRVWRARGVQNDAKLVLAEHPVPNSDVSDSSPVSCFFVPLGAGDEQRGAGFWAIRARTLRFESTIDVYRDLLVVPCHSNMYPLALLKFALGGARGPTQDMAH